MIGWYCPNKFQCNILLNHSNYLPYTVDLILKCIVIIWKKLESEVKYGDKTMTNSISHGKLKDEIHGCMDSNSW